MYPGCVQAGSVHQVARARGVPPGYTATPSCTTDRPVYSYRYVWQEEGRLWAQTGGRERVREAWRATRARTFRKKGRFLTGGKARERTESGNDRVCAG